MLALGLILSKLIQIMGARGWDQLASGQREQETKSSACTAGVVWALLELELDIKYPVAFEGQSRQKHKAMG